MTSPTWLSTVRRAVIIDTVNADPRTSGDLLLGIPWERARKIIEYGQADFCTTKEGLSVDDLALLYAWINQLQHVEELMEAFQQLFHGTTVTSEDPVVLDLGCGPFTGGLALTAVLGPGVRYTYVGIDRAESMLRLGERLWAEARTQGAMPHVIFRSAKGLSELSWSERISWRPIVVIVSYLLASRYLDVQKLVQELMSFIDQVGPGSVTILYTNAGGEWANRNLADFRATLMRHRFEERAGGAGVVLAERGGQTRRHALEYGLFYRREGATLEREEGENP